MKVTIIGAGSQLDAPIIRSTSVSQARWLATRKRTSSRLRCPGS